MKLLFFKSVHSKNLILSQYILEKMIYIWDTYTDSLNVGTQNIKDVEVLNNYINKMSSIHKVVHVYGIS